MKRYRILSGMLIASMVCMVFTACGDSEKIDGEIDDITLSLENLTEETELRTEKETPRETEEPEILKVKDVVGKTEENAKIILKSQGFEVVVEREYNVDVPEGSVISQSPSADNDLALSKGDTISLVVSKGEEPQVAKYLDSIVYAELISESKYTKMSAYSGKDLHGNECTRAIKFECNGNSLLHEDTTKLEQSVKATYVVEEGTESFSCVLAPLDFDSSMGYVHVNLYKDGQLLYSMDISKDTQPLELEYDIKGGSTFTIEITYLVKDRGNMDYITSSVVFSEAKFE